MARAKINIDQMKTSHNILNSYGPFTFYADMFENPTTADWAVNSLAPADADDDHVGLVVRAFDDTTAEGIGFSIQIPTTAQKIKFSFISRAKTAPASDSKVGLNLYYRGIPNNLAVETWSAAFALTDIDIPTNEYYQYDSQLLELGGVGQINLSAGVEYQFQLNRNPSATSNLTGDWFLRLLSVSFE